MDRITRFIYSNKLFAFIMLILQLLTIIVSLVWLSDYRVYISAATTILEACLIIFEVNRTENPNFKITWILLIALIPVFGALLYLYIHADITSRIIGKDQEKAVKLVRSQEKSCAEAIELIAQSDRAAAGSARFLAETGGAPAFSDTHLKYYPLGDYMIEDIISALKKARSFIFIESFIINSNGRVWPEILSILREKVKKGVEVRVLYDGMGCLTTLPKYYEEKLNSEKIKCRTFLPVMPLLSTYQNNRDHRKIIIVDGKTAFTGGVNLADEYANYIERFGHWKDAGVRLRGSAVSGLTELFLQMWNTILADDSERDCLRYMYSPPCADAEGVVIPFGDSPLDDINVGMRVYIDMINRACEHIYIMTPYLVLDDEMFGAMRYAVQRGVDVRLVLPHIPDKKYAFWLARTYYPQLIRSGIRVYEYNPGFVHSKVCECDGEYAVVGTINFDYRSLFLHHECAVYIHRSPVIRDIREDFDNTFYSCSEITMEDYDGFNIFTKLIGRVSRVLAPLI